MLLFSAEEMEGLENAAPSEFRFSMGEEKTCLFIPGLSSNNGLSPYHFFLLLEFNFFPF